MGTPPEPLEHHDLLEHLGLDYGLFQGSQSPNPLHLAGVGRPGSVKHSRPRPVTHRETLPRLHPLLRQGTARGDRVSGEVLSRLTRCDYASLDATTPAGATDRDVTCSADQSPP